MWLIKPNKQSYLDLETIFDYPNFKTFNISETKTAEIKETDNAISISIAVPGIKKEDIKLEYNNETVFISINTNSKQKFSKIKSTYDKISTRFHAIHEYYVGIINFKKSIANLNDGILTIKLAKIEKQKSHVIKIS